MFGWRLVRESELALQEKLTDTRIAMLAAELRRVQEYAGKCERLIDHERERIDSERERADRMADAVFQANGMPPTSPIVLQEQREAEAVASAKRTDYMKELMEIYGETENDLLDSGAEALPEELAEAIKSV